MKKLIQVFIVLVIIGFGVLYNAANIVSEGEQGLLLRHGEAVMNQGKPVLLPPGFHWTVPFVESIQNYDMRLQSYTTDAMQLNTADNQSLNMSLWVQWKIVDSAAYFKATHDNGQVVVNALQKALAADSKNLLAKQTLLAWLSQPGIPAAWIQSLNGVTKAYGVLITAVGINTATVPKDVRANLNERMQAHLNSLLATLNAGIQGRTDVIRAETDAKSTLIMAEAKNQASKIRAQGDAEAMSIYNAAYQASPQFYLFYRSMQTYQAVFTNPNTVLVLRPQGEFFKYFHSFAVGQGS